MNKADVFWTTVVFGGVIAIQGALIYKFLLSDSVESVLVAVIAALAGLLIISLRVFDLELFSIGGVRAHLRSIQSRQDSIENQVRTLQLLVKGLVTDFEYEKLRGLESEGQFMVNFHWDMYHELKRLDAIRYPSGILSRSRKRASSLSWNVTVPLVSLISSSTCALPEKALNTSS